MCGFVGLLTPRGAARLHHRGPSGEGAAGLTLPWAGIYLEMTRLAIVDRRDAEPCALFGAEHLPGHDIGVMFEDCENDFITWAKRDTAGSPGNKVDRFGCATDKNNLLG